MFDDMEPQFEESPTKQPTKYFGMTQMQIAILAGMAGITCLLFLVGGFLALRGGLGLGAAAPASQQNTSTPQPTVTAFVSPTATLTETPTPIPYEQLIPEGWVQYKTTLVEIWMPKGYKQQKPKKSDNVADSLTVNLEIVRPTTRTSLYPVIVIVSYEPLTAASLDAYVEALPTHLSADTRVAGKRKVTINSVEAISVLFETKIDGDDVNDQVYLLLDGSTVWFIQYIAQLNEFYDLLPTFEQSIKTFRMVR